MSEQECRQLAERVGQSLMQAKASMVTAESCTGGWVACVVTAIPGSSQWFERGFVTYTNVSKQEMLDVAAQTLDRYGAVSEQTVREMASGALKHSHAQVSVAISGIAGPGGGSADKPVGTVWLAWGKGEKIRTLQSLFSGDREQVREQAVKTALQGILDIIADDD
jgi:nicotinamide-nucleotide amidase